VENLWEPRARPLRGAGMLRHVNPFGASLPPIPPPIPPSGAGDPQELLRSLPPVGAVADTLDDAALAFAPREEWVAEIRQALSELRARILGGNVGPVSLGRAATSGMLLAAARSACAGRPGSSPL